MSGFVTRSYFYQARIRVTSADFLWVLVSQPFATDARVILSRLDKLLSKGMTGRERSQFTKREDDLLIQYLAVHNPSKDGRMGNAVYRQLEANEDGQWDWASAHTWQSWRERYKKNNAEFDSKIRKYQKLKVISDEPASTSKQKGKGKRKILDWDDDDSEEADIANTATVTKRKRVSDVQEQALKRKKVKMKEVKRDSGVKKMQSEEDENESETAPPPSSSDYSGEIFAEASNTDEDEDMIEVALADEHGEAERNFALEDPEPRPSEYEQIVSGRSSIEDEPSQVESILPPTLPLPTSTTEEPPIRSPESTQLPPTVMELTQSDMITSQGTIHTRESRTQNSENASSNPRPSFTRKAARSQKMDDDIFALSPTPHDVHGSDDESEEDVSAQRRRNQPPTMIESAFGRKMIVNSIPLPKKVQPSNRPVLSPIPTGSPSSSRNNSTQAVDVSLVAVQGSSRSRSTVGHSTSPPSSYPRKGKIRGQDMDVNTSTPLKGTRMREYYPFSESTQTPPLLDRRSRSLGDPSSAFHPQVLTGNRTDLALRPSPRPSDTTPSSPAIDGSIGSQNRKHNASSRSPSADLAVKTRQLLDRLSISPRKGSSKHPFNDNSLLQIMSSPRSDRTQARTAFDTIQEPAMSAIRSPGFQRHPFEEDSQSQGVSTLRGAGSVVSVNDTGRSSRASGDYSSARDRLIDLLLKTKPKAFRSHRESSAESSHDVAIRSPRSGSPEYHGRTINDTASPPSGMMEELTIAFLSRQKNHELQEVQPKFEPEEPEVLLRTARTSEPRRSTPRARFADPVSSSPITLRTATPTPTPPPEPPPSRASRIWHASSPQFAPSAVLSAEANSPLDVISRSRLSLPEAGTEAVNDVGKLNRRRTLGGDSAHDPRTGATPRIDLSARRKRSSFTSVKEDEIKGVNIRLRASSMSTGGHSAASTTSRMSVSDRRSSSPLGALHRPPHRRSLLQTISAYRSAASPLDFPVSDTDRAYIMQHGIAMIIDGLADTHGFQRDVIWNVYKEMKDLPRTEAVLEQMRESADRSAVEAIRRISGTSVLANDGNDHNDDDDNDDEHSEDNDLSRDRSLDVDDLKRRKSNSSQKQRSKPALKYQPVDEHNVYSPHKMTRAAEWARLNGQGRTDEAMLRESKRASLTASSQRRQLSSDVT